MSTTPMKRCTKCGIEYPATAEYFDRRKDTYDGLRADCKWCRKIEKSRYYRENFEEISARKKAKSRENPEQTRKRHREYHHRNKERRNQRRRDLRAESPESARHKDREYYAKKREVKTRQKREYNARHRPVVNKRNRDYYSENTEQLRAQKRDYYARERDVILKRNQEYAEKNPDVIITIAQRRKARERNLPATLTKSDWKRAVHYFGKCCAYCGEPKKLSMDHFIPLTNPNCPGTIPKNIVPACKSCNSQKYNTQAISWINQRFGKEQARRIIERIEAYFVSLDLTA